VYCDGCCKGMPYRQVSFELQSLQELEYKNRTQQAVTTQLQCMTSRVLVECAHAVCLGGIKIFLFHTCRARSAFECTHAVNLVGNQDFPVLHMTSQVSTRVYPCRLSVGKSRFSCFTHDEPGQHSCVPMPPVCRKIKIFLFYTWHTATSSLPRPNMQVM
jgi:hypothetical protein